MEVCHMQKLLLLSIVLLVVAACSAEQAPPSEDAEAKEQTVNAEPKEHQNVLVLDE